MNPLNNLSPINAPQPVSPVGSPLPTAPLMQSIANQLGFVISIFEFMAHNVDWQRNPPPAWLLQPSMLGNLVGMLTGLANGVNSLSSGLISPEAVNEINQANLDVWQAVSHNRPYNETAVQSIAKALSSAQSYLPASPKPDIPQNDLPSSESDIYDTITSNPTTFISTTLFLANEPLQFLKDNAPNIPTGKAHLGWYVTGGCYGVISGLYNFLYHNQIPVSADVGPGAIGSYKNLIAFLYDMEWPVLGSYYDYRDGKPVSASRLDGNGLLELLQGVVQTDVKNWHN